MLKDLGGFSPEFFKIRLAGVWIGWIPPPPEGGGLGGAGEIFNI